MKIACLFLKVESPKHDLASWLLSTSNFLADTPSPSPRTKLLSRLWEMKSNNCNGVFMELPFNVFYLIPLELFSVSCRNSRLKILLPFSRYQLSEFKATLCTLKLSVLFCEIFKLFLQRLNNFPSI